jgi:thiol-disulfide isomerase/thioredoxin
LSAENPKKRRTSDSRFGAISLGATLLIAIAFGVFVLPRIGGTLEREPAPDFALPVIHGGEPGARIRLSEQRGKPVLLDFWASWCKPCRDQARVIDRIREQNPGLVVLGVNVSDSPEAAAAYLAAEKPKWLVLRDEEGRANHAYQVETLPTLVAIDAEGKVVGIRRRFVPQKELAALVGELVAR